MKKKKGNDKSYEEEQINVNCSDIQNISRINSNILTKTNNHITSIKFIAIFNILCQYFEYIITEVTERKQNIVNKFKWQHGWEILAGSVHGTISCKKNQNQDYHLKKHIFSSVIYYLILVFDNNLNFHFTCLKTNFLETQCHRVT